MEFQEDALERAKRVKLIIFDVDGVLTDGGIYIGADGELFKPFFGRDGLGITLARRAGLATGDLRALLGLPFDFIAANLLRSARKFSGRQLEEAVRLCAQTDFAMKNTGADDAELLKELLLRIAVGGTA